MAQPKTKDAPVTLTLSREALTGAFVVNTEADRTLRLDLDAVAEAMAATAKAVLASQGYVVRLKGKAGATTGIRVDEVGRLRNAKARAEPSDIAVRGEGLGELISAEQGRRQLTEIALATPLEHWAGPVLGPKDAAENLGVERSTLHNWRTQGRIIALPKGQSAHIVPMEQFVDRRPLPGLDRILKLASGNAMLAWRWLKTPHVDFEGEPPLRILAAGQEEAVCAVAERSLG
jgi:hypothetical protein